SLASAASCENVVVRLPTRAGGSRQGTFSPGFAYAFPASAISTEVLAGFLFASVPALLRIRDARPAQRSAATANFRPGTVKVRGREPPTRRRPEITRHQIGRHRPHGGAACVPPKLHKLLP